MKRFWLACLQLIVILSGIQTMRALVASVLGLVAHWGNNVALFQMTNSLAFIIVGVVLLLVRRPSREMLGLDGNALSRTELNFYIGGTLGVIVLIVISLMHDWQANAGNLHFVIVIPIFEELLFRGYAWHTLVGSWNHKHAGLATWLVVTVLFGVWHLGYADALLRNPMPLHGITVEVLLATKVGVGLVLGSIVGFVRGRTVRVYGAVLIHALWNLFA